MYFIFLTLIAVVTFQGPVLVEVDTNGASRPIQATSTVPNATITYQLINGPAFLTIDNGTLIIAAGATPGQYFPTVTYSRPTSLGTRPQRNTQPDTLYSLVMRLIFL